ncbi:MAG TPA: zf-HC2 domain-containing protein [Roseiflexaceae bacterium]|nr:zf-HC2 domain-containing protein [Roseiflexaceae bacterium]
MTGYETATTRLVQQELGACALIQDLLPLYMEHEVSASSRDLIAEHLARCERCAGYMAGARSMREQLRREGALRASLAAQDQATQQAIMLGQRRLRWLVVGGLCALFGFGLMMMLLPGIFGSASVKPGLPADFAPTPVMSVIYPDGMPGIAIDPAVEAAPMDPAMYGEPHPMPPDAPQPWPTVTPVPGP